MKKLLITFAILTVGGIAYAQFTPGNLVIYRVGDGAAALSNASTAVFLEEHMPDGTLVGTPIALPTSGAQALTAAGNATSEGFMTLSADEFLLAVPGYNAATGIASIATTSAAANPRAVALIDGNGAISTLTTLGSTSFSAGNIRSAVTDDTNIWAVGSNTGVVTALSGSTTSTLVSSTATNLRATNIFNAQLYVSSAAGTIRMGTVGTGTPTGMGETITALPGFPTNQAISQFFFADLDGGVAGVDTLYVANQTTTAGVSKYSLVGGSWTFNNTIATPASPLGLTGTVSFAAALQPQGLPSVTIYTTTGVNLYSLTDTNGYNAPINGTLSAALATAGTNMAFRGVAFAPGGGSAPFVKSAVSRKTHGAAGFFDIFLPLAFDGGSTVGIECRTGGATNDFTVIVQFAAAVTVNGSPQAQVTSGTGCVGSGGTCSPNGTVTVAGNEVTIPLTTIADQQVINIRLNGVNNASANAPEVNFDIPMGRLLGDGNGNGAVNAGDVAQTKSRIGLTVTFSNFRSDFNAGGSINAGDVSIAKANTGHGLPPQ